jgi:hypothetical protein
VSRPIGRTPLHLDPVEVARVVTEARVSGLFPVSTVSEVFEVPLNRASREIARARDLGVLDPQGHSPTKAVINRATSRQREWIVCEHDLQAWPCPYIQRQHQSEPTTGVCEDDADQQQHA